MCNVIMDFRQQVKKMESMVWFLAVAGDGVVGSWLNPVTEQLSRHGHVMLLLCVLIAFRE